MALSGLDLVLANRKHYAKQLLIRSHINSDGCRIWLKGKDKDGYGIYSFYINSSRKSYTVRAHRAAFVIKYGVMPCDEIHHECEQKSCINPLHLSDISGRDNSRLSKGWTFVDSTWYCKRGHKENLYTRPYSTTTQCVRCTIERSKS